MDNWTGHVIFHTFAYFLVTLPLTWALFHFMLNEPMTVTVALISMLTVALTVFVLGLLQFGWPRR